VGWGVEEVKNSLFKNLEKNFARMCFVVILIMITNSNCGNMHMKLVYASRVSKHVVVVVVVLLTVS